MIHLNTNSFYEFWGSGKPIVFINNKFKEPHTLTHPVRPTVVGAGSCVLGAGLADDVLVDLVPFVLIVTPGEQQEAVKNVIISSI